jgi:restriction endonuclease S subunit
MPPFTLKIGASFFTETNSKSSIMASVEAFKSAVVRIRDILRGPGVAITGMDSMRHICLYLLSRYMTKDKVKSLGVPDEFAWENLIETAQTKNGGVQKALDCFFHKETDCLVNHFDRLFGTENFSFDIKNPAKHKEMLEILDKVNIEQIDCQMDTLGWVYEQHLKTGSSAARDLGQFFTDRFICDYMVALCKPGFKSKGVPESVCDPSMGTGGFLTSYMKFYKKNHANSVDWSIQNKEIHGCDTDPKVAGVARLNLFMESGGNRAVNLRTHDSLYGDLTQTGYDLILANMPFGLKGIKHAECCERVNKLKIRGTKSEPLFLQLMMVSLNRGGRCAVVVPDGMLVNGSSCHDETRKYLLDHFELKRVIKMKGQFFMNTGIQPSILFFENTCKPTSVVEFWDVIKGANGDIEETMVLSVPRAKFDASCSFDMRRYQEVKAVANPAGFPMVKLGDIAELCRNNTEIVDDANGMYTKYFGPKIVGKCSNYHFDGEYILTPGRQSIGLLGYVNGKFTTTHTFVIKVKPEYSSKYVYYYLLLNDKLSEKSKGIIPYIKNEDVLTLQVIVPPLETQKEIVATLDRIYAPGTTELAETLKLTDKAMDIVLANPGGASLEPIVEAQRLMRKSAQMVADVKAQMVADIKAQMVAVMKSVNMRGFEMKKLDEVCRFVGGKGNQDRSSEYTIPYYESNGIFGFVKDALYTGEYIITARCMSIGAVHYVNGAFYPSDHTINMTSIDVTKLNNRFLYYWLLMNNDILKAMSSGIKPGIRKSDVVEIKMPIPPIDFQLSVLKRMDDLESQHQVLITLGKKSEDNARFILDSYLNTA